MAPPAFLLFFFFFSAELSTVVCCPCESVEVVEPSLTLTSPFCATIWTVPSEPCLTSNCVQPFETGTTVTSPAWVPSPLDVATVKAPCSSPTAGPSNLTSESAKTTTLEPEALMLAIESDRVWTISPGNTAEAARHRAAVNPRRSLGIEHGRAGIRRPQGRGDDRNHTPAGNIAQPGDTHAQLRSSTILAIILSACPVGRQSHCGFRSMTFPKTVFPGKLPARFRESFSWLRLLSVTPVTEIHRNLSTWNAKSENLWCPQPGTASPAC